jgi:hypothetical protein
MVHIGMLGNENRLAIAPGHAACSVGLRQLQVFFSFTMLLVIHAWRAIRMKEHVVIVFPLAVSS